MLDRWVQATLEWEDVSRLGRLRADQWDRVSQADQWPREGWSAEYVGWTFAGLASHGQVRKGRTNGSQGALR